MSGDPPETGPLSSDLEAAVVRCAGLVRSVASKHGLAGDDVDEVFQEVRIRLWKSLESGEKIRGVPASYVYRTATSAALDLIRRRRARPAVRLEVSDGGMSAIETRENPSRDLERSELRDRVMAAVDGLLESRRPVVRMHLMGYKLDEIADLLGWSAAKTRNLLYRGLEDLRAALTDAGIASGDLA